MEEPINIPSNLKFNTSFTGVNKKMVLGLVILIILAIGIALGVYLVGQRQIFKPKAAGPVGTEAPAPSPETSFTLAADSSQVTPNSLFKVSVLVKSDIDAANLFVAKLKFPADLLQVSNMVIGPEARCVPRPACLDAKYPCRMSEPSGGWCPKVSVPTITTAPISTPTAAVGVKPPRLCAQVITHACEVNNPTNCSDFPTPCDVPEGWIRQDLPVVKGISFGSAYFVSDWVEKFYDNQLGTISLIGSVPNPGYKTAIAGKGGLMADIFFIAKKAGTANVSFAETAAIYRNSDNMNILTIKREISLLISSPTQLSEASSLQGDVNGNGRLDLGDMSTLMSKLGQTGANIGSADLNSDGTVNAQDLSILQSILSKSGVLGGRGINIPTLGSKR